MQYGFGEELTKENILKKISSYDIFKYYSENFVEIGKSFNSDLPGREDKDPSACISVIKNDLLFTDFGAGKSFRCIDYVSYKLGLSYFDTLKQINDDFSLELGNYIGNVSKLKKQPILAPKIELIEKTPSILKKRQRLFTEKDLKYWSDFYWTEWMLKKANIQSLENYWVNGYQFDVKPDELAFSYEYYWVKTMLRKFYFPLRKKYKWITNSDSSIVQLHSVAPRTGDLLIISKSMKDSGIYWRVQLENMFPNMIIHSVSPNCEGQFLPEPYFRKMEKRWKRIVLWWDNDWDKPTNTGVTNSMKFAEKYNIEWVVNPDGEPKDASDFAKKYSLVEFKNLIQDKLKI
jgi:hypothetical protein